MPTREKTYWVNPEQSKPVEGLVPPYWYIRPSYWAAIARTPPAAGLRLEKSRRVVERLTWPALRSETGATVTWWVTGFGLGLGLAVAAKPMTPKASAACGAAASGALTATGALEGAAFSAAGAAVAAEAGRAKEATRPPEAAMTAEVLTAGWADF